MIKQIALNSIMIIVSAVWLAPLWLMVIFATHGENTLYMETIPLLPGKQFLNNFATLQSKYNFLLSLKNSAIISSLYAVCGLALCAMAGYALAKFCFRGKVFIFAFIMFTLTIPPVATLIPQYIIVVRELQLSNSIFGVFIPYLASAFGVFFMRQIFTMYPTEVIEAARIDGAKEWYLFIKVVLPMVMPALASLGILLFLTSWNDYLWPLLILQTPDSMTAPVVLGKLIGLTRIQWASMMAGVMVMTIPFVILFLFLQRFIISGITEGSVK